MKKFCLMLAAALLLSTAALAAESDCSHANVELVITEAATCEEMGEGEIVCLDCGETIQTLGIPALSHNYVENVVEPTCETVGYTEMVCTNCGDCYAIKGTETPALGHEYLTVQEATCAHDGIAECTRCHEQITIAALEHTFVYNNDAVTNADGTVISYGTKTCSLCGAIEPASVSDYVAPVGETASVASGDPSNDPSNDPSGEASGETGAEASDENTSGFSAFVQKLFRSIVSVILAMPSLIVSLF